MKAQRLTIEQVKNDSIREYNPTEWNKVVDRHLKHLNVEFFKVAKDDIFQYDRFFVKYTLLTGLTLFNSLSYSSMLSDSGFQEVFINEFSFENNVVEFYPENEVLIKFLPMKRKIEETGEVVNVMLNNSIEARKYMIKASQRIGAIWTKL